MSDDKGRLIVFPAEERVRDGQFLHRSLVEDGYFRTWYSQTWKET